MDRAYIYASISTSLQVAELSILGQLVFERMFPQADFQGRLVGHPRKVRAIVIPMLDVSCDEVAVQLQKKHDLGLIIWYEAEGEKYIQLASWWKFQRRRYAHPSKFPPPEGWQDRLRYNDPVTHKLVEVNWDGQYGRKARGANRALTNDPYIASVRKSPIQDSCDTPVSAPFASASATKDPLSESLDTEFHVSSDEGGIIACNGITPTAVEVDRFFRLWNEEAVLLPKAREFNATRRRKIRARLQERTISEWGEIFRRMNASPFLRGEIGNGTFRADLDWVIGNEGNAVKVLEGRYDNRGASKRSSHENALPTGTAGRTLEIL